MAIQGGGTDLVIADPVRIPTPKSGEASIEAGCGRYGRRDPDICRKPAIQPATGQQFQGRNGYVEVRHLAAGMHPGIRATRANEVDGSANQVSDEFLQDSLDGPTPGLPCPPGEFPTVVGHVQPKTDQPVARGSGDGLIMVAS